jgi:hypothetical protein
MRSLDTTPDAERIQLEVFRRIGPGKRLQAPIALSQTCRKLLIEGVRRGAQAASRVRRTAN